MKKTAFPYLEIDHSESAIQNKTVYYDQDTGISQRLYIATKIACAKISITGNWYQSSPKSCFKIADELIKQDNETN